MKKLQILFIALLLLALYSCKKDEDAPDDDKTEENGGSNGGGEVSPSPTFLKVGTAIKYDVNFLFSYDSMYAVIDEQMSENIFRVRNYSTSSSSIPTQYFKLVGDDLYTSTRLRDDDNYYIECRFGKPVGTKWDVSKNLYDYEYEIVGVNETVTTKEGSIDDVVKIKVTRKSNNSVSYQYVSPSVGVLGTGNYEDEPSMRTEYYTIGTTPYDPSKTLPAITYGNFDFLKVGNYWLLEDEWNDLTSRIDIESKLVGKNVYKVKNTVNGSAYYSYWFEDNGYLKVYEEGENELQADPIYIDESLAKVGEGWSGISSTTVYLYKIGGIDQSFYSDFYSNTFDCMTINVGTGFFSSQINYWNAEKGQIYIGGGFVEYDLTDSNAKRGDDKWLPLTPM